MKAKTIFFCTECGNEFPKWQGRCPICGNWNTIVEQPSERVRGSARPAVEMCIRDRRQGFLQGQIPRQCFLHPRRVQLLHRIFLQQVGFACLLYTSRCV